MLLRGASGNEPAAVDIKSTAFRDDREAELVTITALSFDGCQLSSTATFDIGERLRLHVPGQGWIEAAVQSSSDGKTRAIFAVDCKV